MAWRGRLLLGLLALACGIPGGIQPDGPQRGDGLQRGEAAREGAYPAEARPIALPEGQPAALGAWSEAAERLRGLNFRRPVHVRPLIRSEIPATIRQEIEEMLPPGEVEAYRDAYAALGAFPPNVDLVETFAAIYGDQMVGRYDRDEGALYLLDGETPGGYPRETVAIHELVHALQDQHFPRVMALAEDLRHNDDVVTALSGVIEGDASFTMLGAEDLDPSTDRTLAAARSFRDGMLAELEQPSGSLARAPRLIQVSVVSPYAFGVVLAAHRYAHAGNQGLDDLLRDAPLGTVEVLYPGPGPRQKVPVEFIELPLAMLEAELESRSCSLGHHNVAGSLTLAVLVDQYGPEGAAPVDRGWRGDRFVHARCPEGAELAWLTRWADPGSAARFAARYGEMAESIANSGVLLGVPEAHVSGRSVLVVTPGLRPLVEPLLAGSEIRAYRSFEEWLADDCFGEGEGCPKDDRGRESRGLDSSRGMIANPGSAGRRESPAPFSSVVAR